jgi:hypothetical protein
MEGNDSMAGAVIYAYHLLSSYPDTLSKPHQEHTEMFGASTALLLAPLLPEAGLTRRVPLCREMYQHDKRSYLIQSGRSEVLKYPFVD